MPTISHDFDNRRSSRDQVRRRNRRWSKQGGTRRSSRLETLVIKTLSMIVVGEGVDG
jgi:hypothetical protein